ncbi:Endonuclease/exonuclease/phosphatase [Paraphysoderma sedebokerense]|nr:Endonuclease/exonuclease/phosphatase [Paraphysoderma sedebokerense]
MPLSYDFLQKYKTTPGQLKIVSWNVNSLNASLKKGFKFYVEAENPDILCLQETKLNDPMHGLFSKGLYPWQYFTHSQDKKGYSGSAIFSKVKPLNVTYGLPSTDLDNEGRLITLEFSKFYLVAAYVPNAGEGLKRLDYKQEWDKEMKRYLNELDGKDDKYLIWAGDLNVAHQEIDLARPKTNSKYVTPGFTPEERQDFTDILNSEPPLIDTWRHLHPDLQRYTYFSYRFQCRKKNLGWRLDYFVVSERLMKEGKVVSSEIREECYGASDHVPIALVVKDLMSDEEQQKSEE